MGQLQIIKASAGSGKTYTLTLEYIKSLIASPESYKNILAVTFTNKATAEMKERILKELCSLVYSEKIEKTPYYSALAADQSIENSKIRENSQKALRYILHDYSRFSISTIDKFFQKILRSFMRELDLEGGYQITFDNDYLTEMAIDKITDSAKHTPELWDRLSRIVDENIEQNSKINIKDPLKKLAGKINDYQFQPISEEEQTLYQNLFSALRTHYKEIMDEIADAAKEVLELLKRHNIEESQLPGKSRSFVSNVKKISSGKETKYTATTKKTADGDGKWDKLVCESAKNEIIKELSALLYTIDNTAIIRNSCTALAKNDFKFLLLGDLNSAIDQISKQNGSLLLSSSMKLLTSLIESTDAPFIYEKCGTFFSKYMIDEFQDTSLQQWQNFKPLLDDSLSCGKEGSTSVTLLGDVKQSIYGWRGGDWKLLAGEAKTGVDEVLVNPDMTLETNYRSEGNIIEFNNRLISAYVKVVNSELNHILLEAEYKKLISSQFREENNDILSEAYCDSEQKIPDNKSQMLGYIEASVCSFEDSINLQKTVEIIEDAQDRGFKAGDIAILIRETKEAVKIANYIIEYKRNNPEKCLKYSYDFVSAEALKLSKNKAVNIAIGALKIATLKNREHSIESFLSNFLLNDSTTSQLSEEKLQFFISLEQLSTLEAFEQIITHFALGENGDDVAYIQALHQKIVSFTESKGCDKQDFIEWWENEGCKSSLYMPQTDNSIVLSTIHTSKGLEFKVVILPFLNWRNPPRTDSAFWAKSDIEPFDKLGNIVLTYTDMSKESAFSQSYHEALLSSYVESTNVLYVAVTRSRSELYLMLPQKKEKNHNSETIETVLNSFTADFMSCNEDKTLLWFGEKLIIMPETNSLRDNIYLQTYLSHDYRQRIAIKPSLERYYDNQHSSYLSPRHYGVIMHRLFENASTFEQVKESLEQMYEDSKISLKDKEATVVALEKAFQNPLIVDWFSPKWEVRAENDILIPASKSGGKYLTSRPDRVLISDNETVVIDYKFGMKNSKHHAQVAAYVELLKEMGYKNVSGYVWYIVASEVERV